jgi:hypothetical protein
VDETAAALETADDAAALTKRGLKVCCDQISYSFQGGYGGYGMGYGGKKGIRRGKKGGYGGGYGGKKGIRRGNKGGYGGKKGGYGGGYGYLEEDA